MKVDIKSYEDVIESGQWVQEPALELKDKILGSDAKRIITTGGYGVGKSITLFGLQHLTLPTHNKILCTSPKRSIIVPEGYEEEEFLKYYFDVKYLEYLKKRLKITSGEKIKTSPLFKDLGEIDERSRTLYEAERGYSKPKNISSLILGEAVDAAKEITGASTISVAVDDFDLNPKTENGQRILVDTLNCFDKTIIGINSGSLTDEEQRTSLESSGYEFMSIDYSSNPEVLKQIVRRRVLKGKSLIADLDYESLIFASSGDVLSILKAIEQIKDRKDAKDAKRVREFLERSLVETQEYRSKGKMLLR